MRISTLLNYANDPTESARQAKALESAGVDMIWIPEAYGFDAVSLLGYLAAETETVGLGSGILNTYSRTPAALAQTAASLDSLSGGRFTLGFFFQAEDGIRGRSPSRGLGDVYKRQVTGLLWLTQTRLLHIVMRLFYSIF